MKRSNPREIKVQHDHMFDELLATGNKTMTRRPMKVLEIGKLARVKFWVKTGSIYGEWEGYEKELHLEQGLKPLVTVDSRLGQAGDWFTHKTADGKELKFEIEKIRPERLWNMPDHEAKLEGFDGPSKFFEAWEKFYPIGSPFSPRENPWVWVCEFRQKGKSNGLEKT